MATVDQIQEAIRCLSTAYPQFVSKELASLTDAISTAIQGFTDPLAAADDLGLNSLVESVKENSAGDIFDNLSSAGGGLLAQHTQREGGGLLADMATQFPNATKRVQQIQNLSSNIARAVNSHLALYPEFPYIAAQRMCESIIELTDLKARNVECLRRHIIQLTNAVFVLIRNQSYKDDTMADLAGARDRIALARAELAKSQVVRSGETIFDQSAFTRAREAVVAATRFLTPDKSAESILDVLFILSEGSLEAHHINRENSALAHIVIPSLIDLVEKEVAAIVKQVEIINFYVSKLGQVIANFRNAGSSSQIKAERARAIASMARGLTELQGRIELAIDRNSLGQASAEALIWVSKLKVIIAMMDDVGTLTLQEGSIEGPDRAFVLEQAFQGLLADLTGIETALTEEGIEDPIPMRDKILALTLFARKVIAQVDEGKVSPSKLATFHQLAQQTAGDQLEFLDDSVSVGLQQKAICQEYVALDMGAASARFDNLVDSMRQLGLDRGVDMLNLGRFTDFLDTGSENLSYLGAAVSCLTDALSAIDDEQTRRQVAAIRDDMVARKANEDIATADAADQGRSRFISKIQSDISDIQRNAATIESIADSLTELLRNQGETPGESFGVVETFLGNLDQLSVGAGGRLSGVLEAFSEHANAGVPEC